MSLSAPSVAATDWQTDPSTAILEPARWHDLRDKTYGKDYMYAACRVNPDAVDTIMEHGLDSLAVQARDSSASEEIKQRYSDSTNRAWFQHTPEMIAFKPIFDDLDITDVHYRIPVNSVVIMIDPKTTYVYDSSTRNLGKPLIAGQQAYLESGKSLSTLVDAHEKAISDKRAYMAGGPHTIPPFQLVTDPPPPEERAPCAVTMHTAELLSAEGHIPSRLFVKHQMIPYSYKSDWIEDEEGNTFTRPSTPITSTAEA